MALLANLSFVITDTQFDICEFTDATPEFYYEYGIDECSPRFFLAPNGVDCEYYQLDKKVWASFCQIRTTFHYGQEQPYVRVPVCRGKESCSIGESVHQSYGWKIKTNGNFKEGALTAGITGGYNKSGVSQSYKITKTLRKDTCGYWTFIPYVKTTCGTYTSAAIVGACCEPDLPWYTNGNACADQAISLDDPFWSARTICGDTVLVYVDCKTLLPLPNEQQEWSYRQDGVKQPRHYHDAYVDLWHAQLGNENANIVEANDVQCDSKTQADVGDCVDAISMLLSDPGKNINYHKSLAVSAFPFHRHTQY